MAIRLTKICDVTGDVLDDDLMPDRITWQGQTYDLYLSNEGAERIASFLEPILEGAERVDTGTKTVKPSTTVKRDDLAQIRAWAQENGKEVAAKGRIKESIIDAYDAAHKK